MVKIKPVIKWSGSKRSQSETIVGMMPKEIDTYYEPFIGGASVLFQLLHSDIKVNKYKCSDINNDLITLWNAIKDNPDTIFNEYSRLWNELNFDDDVERRKEYFYSVRKRFNDERNPEDFLFLSRTCTNGLIRYNSSGNFNTSLHFSRKGIIPDTFEKILLDWSEKLNKKNVEFIHRSFEDIASNDGDFLYLDPPYANTKGMYYGKLNYDAFWDWLSEQKGKYMLSFDGTSGKDDHTYKVPESLYVKHEYIDSGSSSFKRVVALNNEFVRESLYIK